jgi:hypothetical protein
VDEFLAFQQPEEGGLPITEVRSTLLVASLKNIRARGWEERYLAELPPELARAVRESYAGTWLPVELALEHYQALDRLHLSPHDIAAAGVTVASGVQELLFSLAGALARAVGSSPWVGLARAHRLWNRIFVGGDVRVCRIDDRTAQIEIKARPLADSPFFRSALPEHFRIVASFMSNSPATVSDAAWSEPSVSMSFQLRW